MRPLSEGLASSSGSVTSRWGGRTGRKTNCDDMFATATAAAASLHKRDSVDIPPCHRERSITRRDEEQKKRRKEEEKKKKKRKKGRKRAGTPASWCRQDVSGPGAGPTPPASNHHTLLFLPSLSPLSLACASKFQKPIMVPGVSSCRSGAP